MSETTGFRFEITTMISDRGVCTKPPCYCVVMEFCPNGTLYNLLRNGGSAIPPRLTFDWAVQIASGMHYLHSHKIIHRDLKSPKYLVQFSLSLPLRLRLGVDTHTDLEFCCLLHIFIRSKNKGIYQDHAMYP